MTKSSWFRGCWYLDDEDLIETGDISVVIPRPQTRDADIRKVGKPIVEGWIGHTHKEWQKYNNGTVYRRRVQSGPVRLPLNPIHSEPVPLP